MSKKNHGFTLIEVGLFLAITGVLVMGIMIGTGNSLSQQRYKDSVQDFAEFLRRAYSSVNDTENIGDGRSEKAIYGKLITFGEKLDFDGNHTNPSENTILVYDVVGNVEGSFSAAGNTQNVLSQLASLNANVITAQKNAEGNFELIPAGFYNSYVPKWGAVVETTDGDVFKGAILIVRSPKSGTIYTFMLHNDVNNLTVEVNESIKDNPTNLNLNPLTKYIDNSDVNISFKSQQIDFCIADPGMNVYNNARQDVRLPMNSRNATSVTIISLDDQDPSSGNQCRR